MKVMQVVQLRDIRTNTWDQPRFVDHIEAYLRDLKNAVNSNDTKNSLCINPEDFEAYHLGTWVDSDFMGGQNEDATIKEGLHLFPKKLQLCAVHALVETQ